MKDGLALQLGVDLKRGFGILCAAVRGDFEPGRDLGADHIGKLGQVHAHAHAAAFAHVLRKGDIFVLLHRFDGLFRAGHDLLERAAAGNGSDAEKQAGSDHQGNGDDQDQLREAFFLRGRSIGDRLVDRRLLSCGVGRDRIHGHVRGFVLVHFVLLLHDFGQAAHKAR